MSLFNLSLALIEYSNVFFVGAPSRIVQIWQSHRQTSARLVVVHGIIIHCVVIPIIRGIIIIAATARKRKRSQAQKNKSQ